MANTTRRGFVTIVGSGLILAQRLRAASVPEHAGKSTAPRTNLKDYTADDYRPIFEEINHWERGVPDHMLDLLKVSDNWYHGFEISQLAHMLQSATRAHRQNASDDLVLAALVHDVGKVVSYFTHGAVAADMIKPYVSETAYNVLRNHADFEGQYYYNYIGRSNKAYERFAKEPWYDAAQTFAREWDAPAFDPSYKSMTLGDFEPLIRQKLALAHPLQFQAG